MGLRGVLRKWYPPRNFKKYKSKWGRRKDMICVVGFLNATPYCLFQNIIFKSAYATIKRLKLSKGGA